MVVIAIVAMFPRPEEIKESDDQEVGDCSLNLRGLVVLHCVAQQLDGYGLYFLGWWIRPSVASLLVLESQDFPSRGIEPRVGDGPHQGYLLADGPYVVRHRASSEMLVAGGNGSAAQSVGENLE